MRLRDAVQQELLGLKGTDKKLSLDTFGTVMDEIIKKSSVGLMVTKEEGSEEWKVQGAGLGAVMDFYIFLHALRPLYLQMLEEIGHQLDGEKLADSLAELLQEELRGAGAEAEARAKAAGAEDGKEETRC